MRGWEQQLKELARKITSLLLSLIAFSILLTFWETTERLDKIVKLNWRQKIGLTGKQLQAETSCDQYKARGGFHIALKLGAIHFLLCAKLLPTLFEAYKLGIEPKSLV